MIDLWPEMVTDLASTLAVPLTEIFNTAMEECVWPSVWKVETVSVIPKAMDPEHLVETRNISCTPLFSKVLEFFVLERLRNEVKIDNSQYGSTAGVGTNHYHRGHGPTS